MHYDKKIDRNFLSTIPKLHSKCDLKKHRAKSGSNRRQVVHPQAEHSKKNQLQSLELSCWLYPLHNKVVGGILYISFRPFVRPTYVYAL